MLPLILKFVEIYLVGSAKLFYFCKSDVSAIQGHPKSLFWYESNACMWLPISPS